MESQEELRHRYVNFGHLFYDVLRIVSKHDPERLLAMGCPDDEYLPEAATIFMRLGEATSEERMRRVVYQELKSWFGSVSMSRRQLDRLSRELWEYWEGKKTQKR